MIRFSRKTKKNLIVQILAKTSWKMKATWLLLIIFIYLVKHNRRLSNHVLGVVFLRAIRQTCFNTAPSTSVNTNFTGTQKSFRIKLTLNITKVCKGHVFQLWNETGTMDLHTKNWSPRCGFFLSKDHHWKQVLGMCTRALFALLWGVKKCSEERSSFCFRSTLLRFAGSKVVIATIVGFINTPDLVQCDKHMESWLSSPLPNQLCEPASTFAPPAHSLKVLMGSRL